MTRLLALTLLAGCLSVPRQQKPACSSSDDCGGGEVCDEGVCYGNPPAGMFAAALGAPSDRTNVVQTELPQLAVPSDGWLGDVVIDSPITLAGRVVAYCAAPMACTDATLPATITVTRASLFPGGIRVDDFVTWVLAALVVWVVTALGGWLLPLIFLKKKVAGRGSTART